IPVSAFHSATGVCPRELGKGNQMYENTNTFGRFVREKRLDAGDVTLKDIGYAVGVSLSYYSDIEHDRRNPGEGFDYEALAKLLKLSESEKAHMYDLAGKCRKTVPEDIEDVMMNTESGNMARMALRMTKAGIAKEDDWKEFIRQLERKKIEEQKE
ncbi:MAG: helix-turn-helix domain-containing protein, partial [Lachnospiraceae bacterium]|nr:helix-turn-helix domain-containing protein [Lachnospiraceae bacterium]